MKSNRKHERRFFDRLDRKTEPIRISAEVSGDEATIYLYDEISYWGVNTETFVGELKGIAGGTIHLRVNSPGGDVFEARTMQTAMKQHPARVVAHIDGIAASAASFIAMAADEIEIAEGAFIMIHNAISYIDIFGFYNRPGNPRPGRRVDEKRRGYGKDRCVHPGRLREEDRHR